MLGTITLSGFSRMNFYMMIYLRIDDIEEEIYNEPVISLPKIHEEQISNHQNGNQNDDMVFQWGNL